MVLRTVVQNIRIMGLTPHGRLPPGRIRVRRGAFRWELIEPLARWLDGDGELPISEWLALGVATVIKSGPHRAVYRLILPQGTFYLKHYRTPDWQAVLQNVVRPAKADLEWRSARRVSELGLKTIETVAVGRRRVLGVVTDNFLISRAIENVQPLDEFVAETLPGFESSEQCRFRQEIARRLGRLAAALHRGGILHRDLHPGNVLIQRQDNGAQLFLIDLHALHQKRFLTRRQIARNLALLNNFFARRSSLADRCRFLKAYFEASNQRQPDQRISRDTLRFVESICRRELEKADVRGDKKWRRGNRRLIILETPPHRCRGLSGLGRVLLQSLKQNPDQLVEDWPLFSWQKSAEGDQQAVIELPYNRQTQRAVLTVFRSTGSARGAWEMGHALVRRKLPAAVPLLFVETPAGRPDYFITEEIAGAVTLKRGAWELKQTLPPTKFEDWISDVAVAVARNLQSLHEHGFHYSDITLSSLLVATEGPLRLWFASLEKLRQHTGVSPRDVQKTFAQLGASLPGELGISRSARLRFLRSYLGPRFAAEWKSYWRNIAGLSMDFAQREAA